MTVSEAAEEYFAQRVHRNLVTLRSWEFPTSPAWSTRHCVTGGCAVDSSRAAGLFGARFHLFFIN